MCILRKLRGLSLSFLSLFIVNISLLAFSPKCGQRGVVSFPFDNMLMIYAMKVTEKINEKEECYYVEFKNFLKLTFLSLFPTRVFTLSTTLKKKGEKVNFFFSKAFSFIFYRVCTI